MTCFGFDTVKTAGCLLLPGKSSRGEGMLKTSLPCRISLKTCKRSSVLAYAGQKAGGSGGHREVFAGSGVRAEILVLTPDSLLPGPRCLTLGMGLPVSPSCEVGKHHPLPGLLGHVKESV